MCVNRETLVKCVRDRAESCDVTTNTHTNYTKVHMEQGREQ